MQTEDCGGLSPGLCRRRASLCWGVQRGLDIHDALFSIGLLIVGAKLLEGAFKRFGLNSIIAFAVTGAILGPVTGLVEPTHDVDLILSIGIFMFFFLIGLEELDIRGFVAAIRGRLFFASVLSVAFSLLVSLAVTSDIVVDLGLDLDFTQAMGLAGVLVPFEFGSGSQGADRPGAFEGASGRSDLHGGDHSRANRSVRCGLHD